MPVPPANLHHHHQDTDQAGIPGLPTTNNSSRKSSWDLLSNVKKFEQDYQGFDSRNASEAHLVFADGDMPNNKFVKLYQYLLNVSIITRWILFIVPMLGILWIPGILSLTVYPNANIWGVKLLWWSIWLTICWAGWWAALAISRIMPVIARSTIGIVAVASRRYIDWLQALYRYMAFFIWALSIWITWNPIIDNNQHTNGEKSRNAVDLIGKLLFAAFLCAAILLFEKIAIQWIAAKFHERSYAERIADQKFAVKSLVALYRYSHDVPGTLGSGQETRSLATNPKRIFKRLRNGVRLAATATTTAFGNVASEIAGSSVLQPNSPQAMVTTALESANKSRLLARRIFYSFAKPGAGYVFEKDIAPYFPSEEAPSVFSLFDRDGNGDASREEVEMACLEFHREQLSIENSMRDLDSAVGRLDNILMSVYVVVAALIFAVALEAQLLTLVTGAGTLILGLSWLIGSSLQEVLTSIIFLFIKHPFDVGDRVVINKEIYTVKEIRLLSSVFLDCGSALVQAPNTILNTLMSETFLFDVAYSTTFEDLEKLRDKMLEFVKNERRDFQPSFDVTVKDFPEQEKLTLTADIKYKSNWQQGALKVRRRNKWICALKSMLGELNIHGPKGDPDAPASTTRYTQVPWEFIQAKDREEAAQKKASHLDAPVPTGSWHLRGKDEIMTDPLDKVFGEESEMRMPSSGRGLPEEGLHQRPIVTQTTVRASIPSTSVPYDRPQESIELTPR
ncbi:hypothetical protein AGABI2DRAFT_204597, partial [Agaricus bisporus var. bisporus H97]|uniref:hypothetical protein n=1 Tax=Agaricus bisporus var. bisporus (strain H97 / ATCC MYA-4626 / FGSC 10389) TaxID=936046 RepID=UPI00029F4F5B